MIHLPLQQGSHEWLMARMGIPTASEFSRIITPAKLELAAARHTYATELLTELLLGIPLSNVTTAAMQHGKDWEETAVRSYEFDFDAETTVCGLCITDDRRVGASPDRFVGDDGSLEVKSPMKPEVHVGYLFDNALLVKEYGMQVQGQLYVTGRKWTDLISYFSGLPMVRVRLYPDERVQSALQIGLTAFIEELDAKLATARSNGWLTESTSETPERELVWH